MVAHFDHRLRTEEEAAADLDFVRSLASSLCLPLVHSGSDVRAYARERHVSIEDAARRLRYKYLAEEAAIHDAGVVAVGHTIDDQAETVLLHLIRGSGLTGTKRNAAARSVAVSRWSGASPVRSSLAARGDLSLLR